MNHPISISGIASISALGSTTETVWNSYLNKSHLFNSFKINNQSVWVSKLNQAGRQELAAILDENPNYKKLDTSVQMAIYAARLAMANFKGDKSRLGINIGSSRGATTLFEKYHNDFLSTGGSHPMSSPTTTLGNISSWVAQDLGSNGIALSHSITCSSALHAVLNGVTWLEAGRADAFLVGGSEAPLTPFTIAQMQALKLYSKSQDSYPCKSMLEEKKQNTMILGEGATAAVLQKGISNDAQAVILGLGWGTEALTHPASISVDAHCFKISMKMALNEADLKSVDAIVLHAPGTVLGDAAELNAIKTIFNDELPFLTSNKWKIGHTLGASGGFSLELGVLMLQHNRVIETPLYQNESKPTHLKTVMINAVGFGGNAVSIIIGKP